ALVLAACLTGAVLVGVARVMEGGRTPQPETQTITPDNVGQLQEIARDITFPQEGFRLATNDGVLAMGTSHFRNNDGEVIVYAFPCGDADNPCSPLWHARIDGFGSPIVYDGVVYVTGLHGRTLYAFDERCRHDGGTCSPLWTGDVGATAWITPPVVETYGSLERASTDRVFVGTDDAGLAFDSGSCEAGSGTTCSPVWRVPIDQPARALLLQNGLYVGTGQPGPPDPSNKGSVILFDTSCDSPPSASTSRCEIW